MARFRFKEDIDYAASLVRCAERPIENDPQTRLHLLRLEFAVYHVFPDLKKLSFTQSVASRDLIVGEAIDSSRDASVTLYADALGVRNPSDVASWLSLQQPFRWVTIRFGAKHPADHRNAFQTIISRDIAGWTVDQDGRDAVAQWVGCCKAAKSLRMSEATIRRRVDELASQGWGTQLLIRTRGQQRRINLTLFRNLLDEAR